MNDTKTVNIGGVKLSIGIAVLLGLVCFIGLCGFLFLARYLLVRRNFYKSRTTGSEEGAGMDKQAAYQLVKKGSVSIGTLSEDQLRQIRYDTYRRNTVSTASSDRTRVESLSFGMKSGKEDDSGFKIKTGSTEDLGEVWDPLTALEWGGDATVGRGRRRRNESNASSALPHNSSSPEASPDSHRRQQSDSERIIPSQHQPQRSVDIPLLSAQHSFPLTDERGVVTQETSALADDGSAGEALRDSLVPPPLPSDHYSRAQRIEPRETLSSPHGLYMDMLSYPEALTASPVDGGEVDEMGAISGTGMAGVGTASRTNKISRDSGLLKRDSLFETRR
jgi:hypothetical protein